VNKLYRPVFGFVAVTVFLFVSGCGSDGLKLAKATGKVTLNGNPIGGANVTFMFEDGNLSTGITDNDGKFILVTGGREGAFIGKARVTVTKFNPGNASAVPQNAKPEDMFKNFDAKNPEAMKKQNKPANELPHRYSMPDSSGLTAEVLKSDSNEFTFPLVDSK
jgi:hypothetical protein